MKITGIIQTVCMTLLLSVASCTDHTFLDNRLPVEEGLPTHVKIEFDVEDAQAMTRAELDTATESRVNSIYIFLFDNEGNYINSQYYTSRTNPALSYGGDGSYSTGDLMLATQSRKEVQLICIANSESPSYSGLKAQLDEIHSAGNTDQNELSNLQGVVMTMTTQTVERATSLVMTGNVTDSNGNTLIALPAATDANPVKAKVVLKRTDAKVRFEVKTELPIDSETGNPIAWKDFSFTPTDWAVKQVPQKSYLLEHTDDADGKPTDYNGSDAVYFNSRPTVFEELTIAHDTKLCSGGSFSFYMPENSKTPKIIIPNTGTAAEQYALRDAWDKEAGEDANGSKNFTNAHDNSTYVEITGVLSYIDKLNYDISADVRLTIHLGYSVPTGSTETANPNDYNTLRNHSYTYNVTIKGIDNIIVEVREGNEKRPGYEGDVIYSTQNVYNVDAHYDCKVIKIKKSAINNKMQWAIKTPFSSGFKIHKTYKEDGTATTHNDVPVDKRDYRWVKFAINRQYNTGPEDFVRYPGDQNYDDPVITDGSDDQCPNEEKYSGSKYDAIRLMDINQLFVYLNNNIDKLQYEKAKADDGTEYEYVAITAFVDEYLYYKNPIDNTGDYTTLWKMSVDKEDRQLHIICHEAKTSADGNSSVVNSEYSFRQRSIRTVFDVEKEELTTAWGLESVMETDHLPTGDVSEGNSDANGRYNCWQWLKGKRYSPLKWSTVLDEKKYKLNKASGFLSTNYETAAYACMLRNRDLDGDDVIDANEVRWYLASINQLTDIYLGETALDETARLYQPVENVDNSNKTVKRLHYTSSTQHSTDNSWIIWSEEGASRGQSSQSTEPNFAYRCVRNLGMDSSIEPVIGVVPTDLITVVTPEENDGTFLIDATNMNVNARRTIPATETLQAHNHLSTVNKPYAKFRVYSADIPTPDSEKKNANPWIFYQTPNSTVTYPTGYRIPNQRELLIITSRINKNNLQNNLVCQTAFAYKDYSLYKDFQREGFLWLNGNFLLQNNRDEKGYVRPVMDVTE